MSMGWASWGVVTAMPLTEAVLNGSTLLLSERISSAVGTIALVTTAVCHLAEPSLSATEPSLKVMLAAVKPPGWRSAAPVMTMVGTVMTRSVRFGWVALKPLMVIVSPSAVALS